MLFIVFFCFVALIRLTELIVSHRHEKWLLEHGAIEFGKEHYPFMVGMHVLFMLALPTEYLIRDTGGGSYILAGLFLALMLIKLWTLAFLGNYWCTKIYHIPHGQPVCKGPYKYIKHPNYIIVILELAIIPLVFQLYYTALVFFILNAFMLRIRIRAENKAWST